MPWQPGCQSSHPGNLVPKRGLQNDCNCPDRQTCGTSRVGNRVAIDAKDGNSRSGDRLANKVGECAENSKF